MDLRAPKGTPIKAPNHGQVILTGSFLLPGNAVILDHGMGLVTVYYHLDTILVKEGQVVQKGAVIGRAGLTGRVNGAHLHWQAHLLKTKVDPLSLLKLY